MYVLYMFRIELWVGTDSWYDGGGVGGVVPIATSLFNAGGAPMATWLFWGLFDGCTNWRSYGGGGSLKMSTWRVVVNTGDSTPCCATPEGVSTSLIAGCGFLSCLMPYAIPMQINTVHTNSGSGMAATATSQALSMLDIEAWLWQLNWKRNKRMKLDHCH